MLEEHAGGEHQRAGVRDIFPGDVRGGAVDCFEDRAVPADVRARRQPETSDQTGNLIGENVAEEIRRHDHVEALGM